MLKMIMAIVWCGAAYLAVIVFLPLLTGAHESQARIAEAEAKTAWAESQASIAHSTASVAISAVTANTLLTTIIIGGALTLTAIVLVYLLRREEQERQHARLLQRQAVAALPSRHPYWHIEEPHAHEPYRPHPPQAQGLQQRRYRRYLES